jgi:hypothetical protein
LSDKEAASFVVHKSEQRPENTTANSYVPSPSETEAFHSVANGSNPLNRYVDGLDGLINPSTDDLIQWASFKWGIPTDWLRAEYVVESKWNQAALGDRASVSTEWYSKYPSQARISGTSEVYESMGITQIKWRPDNSVGPGTEPLRWKSTAFNLDYQAAALRYYFDGFCSWCATGYKAGEEWASIGAWFSPVPWQNSGAVSYEKQIQEKLVAKPWLSANF